MNIDLKESKRFFELFFKNRKPKAREKSFSKYFKMLANAFPCFTILIIGGRKMKKSPDEICKLNTTIRLSKPTRDALVAHAAKDSRSIAGEVEWILKQYFMNHSLKAAKKKAVGTLQTWAEDNEPF